MDADFKILNVIVSQRAVQHCKLKVTLPILILVTLTNLLKAGLMLYTVLRINEDPIMTIGDAVASFVSKADKHTPGMCLVTARDVGANPKSYFPVGPRDWSDQKRRWKDVVSWRRWAMTLAMYVDHFSYSLTRSI
jgi:hypothetical protein